MLESLFNKVAGPQASIFIKKRLQHRCFSVKLAKFLRTPFLKNTSGGCFCTYCTHMTSHAIWVDEITDIMVSIKRSIKAKTFWKNSFLKSILYNLSFPVTKCIYINTEYWPEYSFKTRKLEIKFQKVSLQLIIWHIIYAIFDCPQRYYQNCLIKVLISL